eukprot:scaffold17531_cov241-Isochrysis_galbana.AAC.4
MREAYKDIAPGSACRAGVSTHSSLVNCFGFFCNSSDSAAAAARARDSWRAAIRTRNTRLAARTKAATNSHTHQGCAASKVSMHGPLDAHCG